MKDSRTLCAVKCWEVGDLLEAPSPDVPGVVTLIRITALGSQTVLARQVAKNGVWDRTAPEAIWDLTLRPWKKVGRSILAMQPTDGDHVERIIARKLRKLKEEMNDCGAMLDWTTSRVGNQVDFRVYGRLEPSMGRRKARK